MSSIQLHHAGRQTNSRVTGQQLIAPSAVPCPIKQEVPHALTEDEIAEVIEWFGQGARRVRAAGFDAVECTAPTGISRRSFSCRRPTSEPTDIWGRSRTGSVSFAR